LIWGFAKFDYNSFKLFGVSRKSFLKATKMKLRTIKLTQKFLMDALQGKPGACASNLPSNVELLSIKYDLSSGQIEAIVRSENFDEIADAYPIPEFKLNYSPPQKTSLSTTPIQKDNSLPLSNAMKAEPKPTAMLQPEPVAAKKTVEQKKPNTSLMEEEFSEAQRKLLSFSADGNFLVVKPVKFLKAEWDDINEVVRSLGGKWVKGDIISYWEVPLE
jgi:hypothetical protein